MIQSKKGLSPGSATSCRIVSEVISLDFSMRCSVVFPREPAKVPAGGSYGKRDDADVNNVVKIIVF